LLRQDDIFADPEALRAQMTALRDMSSQLATEDDRDELLALVDALIAQLDLTVADRADGGWSSTDVVDHVGSLCGRSDLISWIVQA
jgi:hypothetical protein